MPFVGIAEHRGRGHLAVHDAPGPDRGVPDRPSYDPRIRPDPQRSLEPRPGPDFHSSLQDHGTIARVEDHAGLDRPLPQRHPCRVAQHDRAFGHRVRIAEQLDGVLAQQLFQCADEIIHVAEQHAFDTHCLGVRDRTRPGASRRDRPPDGDPLMSESRGSIW